MEKLQQALEKARRERAAVTLDATPPLHLRDDAQVASFDVRRRTNGATAPASEPEPAREVPISAGVLRANRLVSADIEDHRADVFRMLRTRVLQRLEATGKNTLAVCSGNAGEGKTLVACNLAISLARHIRHSVLLADLDLRSPGVHKCFGLPTNPGLVDILKGRNSLSECLVSPGIPRLALLPQYGPVQNSSELLAEPRMASLAMELKRQDPHRIVIYDLPPLLLADDPLVCLRYADAMLLVIQEGRTKRSAVERSVELVGDTEILGIVLNDSRYVRTRYYHD